MTVYYFPYRYVFCPLTLSLMFMFGLLPRWRCLSQSFPVGYDTVPIVCVRAVFLLSFTRKVFWMANNFISDTLSQWVRPFCDYTCASLVLMFSTQRFDIASGRVILGKNEFIYKIIWPRDYFGLLVILLFSRHLESRHLNDCDLSSYIAMRLKRDSCLGYFDGHILPPDINL